MAVVDTAKRGELEIHILAYMQIFNVIVNRSPLDPAQKQQVLKQLDNYLKTEITSPDAFIDHIPKFAKMIGIAEPALANFIGTNFIKSLQQARSKIAKAPSPVAKPQPVAATAKQEIRATATDKYPLIDELMSQIGTIIKKGEYFIETDFGILKLSKSQGGELVGTSGSLYGIGGATTDSLSNAGTPNANSTSSSMNGVSSNTTSNSSLKGAAVKEQSQVEYRPKPEVFILQEILDKLGNHLDVHKKLEAKIFPAGMVADESDDANDTSPDQTEAIGGVNRTLPSSKAPPLERVVINYNEVFILQEILDKLGRHIDVKGKLLPATGLEASLLRSPAETEENSADEEEQYENEIVEPILMTLDQYTKIVQSIRQFQTSGNQEGYKNWIQNEAGDIGKVIVAIINLDARKRKGSNVYWESEYRTLAHSLDLSPIQIQLLHARIIQCEQIQRDLQEVIRQIKSEPPEVVQMVRRIWPQIRMLFNEPLDYDSMAASFKIMLLQVPKQEAREKIQSIIDPVMQKGEL